MLKLKKLIYLGDIIINLDMVVNSEYKKNIKSKLDELWLHSLIHLLGGRHKLNKDYQKMYKLEKRYFKSIN
jgi:rRNA maturation RNase YbeY